MSTNKQPIISFCIPTYNRARCVKQCIEWIRAYKGDDIEIVVSDNGSQDNTYEIISAMVDERLVIVRNENNEGYANNIRRVIDVSRGKFCFFLSDEDEIVVNSIPLIIEIMKQNSDVSVFSGLVDAADPGGEIWSTSKFGRFSGDTAIELAFFNHAYLTGLIINREKYEIIKKSDPEWQKKETFYTHEYLAFKLSLIGDVMYLEIPTAQSHEYNNKTLVSENQINNVYSIDGRVQSLKEHIKIIKENIDDASLREQLLLKDYRPFLYCGTVGYWYLSKSTNRSELMGLDPQKENLLKLFWKYSKKFRTILNDEDFHLSRESERKIKTIEQILLLKLPFACLYETALYKMLKKLLIKFTFDK